MSYDDYEDEGFKSYKDWEEYEDEKLFEEIYGERDLDLPTVTDDPELLFGPDNVDYEAIRREDEELERYWESVGGKPDDYYDGYL